MLPHLRNLIRRTTVLFAWFASFTLLAIMAMTFVDVIGRTFFGRSLVGTVESVELMMGILVFCGLAYTEVKRKHIVVETFQMMFPRPVRRFSEIANSVIAVSIAGLLAWQLTVKTGEVIGEGEFTQILELPYWPTAVVMSVGMVLFLAVLVLRLIDDLLGTR